MCPIIIDYRPKTFDEVIGNKHLISTLRSMAERERKTPGKISRAILLHGRSGCGKTTLARLFAKEVGCSDCNIIEVDVSDNRGIDAVREIKRGARYKPIIGGEKKAYILDECFAKGTKIQRFVSGNIVIETPIEKIKVGDDIFSLNGLNKAKKTFVNQVSLDRVVRLKFSNKIISTTLFTTKQHEIFGLQWQQAQNLHIDKFFVYCFGSVSLWHNVDIYKYIGMTSEDIYLSRCKDFQVMKSYLTEYKEYSSCNDIEKEIIFKDIIGEKERNQGYVEFFDLQIDGHPSYFANNVPVHNCHGTTSEAQNAFLKILEEPPSHVFFLLCTTAPEKLLETIKNRCKKLKVKPLNDRQMERLITEIAEKENIKLSGSIVDKIASNAEGCPRQALDTLDTIRGLEGKDIEKAISDFSISAPLEIINLCRAMIKGEKWNIVRKLLDEIKDVDVENVRRQVLGYLTSSIKNSDNPSKQMIIAADAFREPYFHNGKAGLILSAYEAVIL